MLPGIYYINKKHRHFEKKRSHPDKTVSTLWFTPIFPPAGNLESRLIKISQENMNGMHHISLDDKLVCNVIRIC
jgi:hypothetical protein